MFARKTYKPIQNRAIDSKGRIDVSREELEDFQRQFGKHLTLRDLLNYDRTQRLPAAPKSEDDQRSRGRRAEKPKSEDDQRARGTQEANIRPNGGAGRGASSGPAADAQYKAPLSADTDPAGPRRDKAAEAKGAETLERMKSRAERGMTMRSNEEMRDEAEGRTLAALGAAATLAGGPLARLAIEAIGRRAAAEGAKRVAEEASRRDPDLGLPPQGSVWHSNRPPKDEIPTLRDAVEDLPPVAPKDRVRVEGTKGGVYRSAKDEKPAEPRAEFRSRTADRMDERGMKRGGTIKSYAKGGSVKGSGCEQRGLRKCKVY